MPIFTAAFLALGYFGLSAHGRVQFNDGAFRVRHIDRSDIINLFGDTVGLIWPVLDEAVSNPDRDEHLHGRRRSAAVTAFSSNGGVVSEKTSDRKIATIV